MLPRLLAPFVLFVALAGACDKGRAGGLAPDFAGTWDIAYDDSLDVLVQRGGEQLRTRVGEHGGRVSFPDGGIAFSIDCAAPELVCPSEVWPHELALEQPPGEMDGDGAQLVRWLSRLGQGPCEIKQGSILTAEVMSTAGIQAVRPEAVAMTSGRITTVVGAGCVAPDVGLPEDTQVILSTGFSAAKR